MGVAEHGHPVRPQRHRRLGRGRHIVGGLAGQAVHQVEIDRRDPGLAQPVVGGGDLVEGLDAVDTGLHIRIERLHPQAGAGHARLARGVDEGVGQHARIQLGRHLGAGPQRKTPGQMADERQEVFRRQGVGAAAAEMQVGGAGVRSDGVSPQIDLAHQGFEEGADPVVVMDDAGVAATVPAQPPTEGHMDIGRERLVGAGRGQPRPGLRLSGDRFKRDRRRIAGVARQVARGVGSPARRQDGGRNETIRPVGIIVRHPPT